MPNIKVFDKDTFECLSKMAHFPYNSDFLIYNDKIYIISFSGFYKGLLYLYNLNGKLIRHLDFCNNYIINLEIYYDLKSNDVFIIIVSQCSLLSYNFTKEKLYHNYSKISNTNNKINIIEDEYITKLICSDIHNITIFDFHNGNILNIIHPNFKIQNFCIWNNQYIIAITEILYIPSFKEFSGMELININNGKVITSLFNAKNIIDLIKVLNHPNYGKCLIVGLNNEKIEILKEKINQPD